MATPNSVTLPNALLFFISFLLVILVFRIESLFTSISLSASSLSLPPNSSCSSSASSSSSNAILDSTEITKIEFAQAEEIYQKNLRQRENDISLRNGDLGDQKTYYIRSVYPCLWEVRIGGWRDGGKWFCKLPSYKSKPLVVYSIGSNGQTEFEFEMWKFYQVKTFTFDPTLVPSDMAKVKALNYIEFQNVGLTAQEDTVAALDELKKLKYHSAAEGARMMKLDVIMKMLGHDFVDIIKIDCKGCELGVMADILTHFTRERPLFGQIMLEIHSFDQFVIKSRLLEKYESYGYRLFRAEQVFQRLNFLEVFYIHESLLGV